MSAICRSCGAKLLWVEMASTGKRMPLDLAPSPRGNIAVSDMRPGKTPVGHVLKSTSSTDLYLSHFVTCPQRGEWRSKPNAIT